MLSASGGRTASDDGAVCWASPVPLSGLGSELRLGARLPRELCEPRSCSTGDLISEPFRNEAFIGGGWAEFRMVGFCRNCALWGETGTVVSFRGRRTTQSGETKHCSQ